jgi:hypothetical protein
LSKVVKKLSKSCQKVIKKLSKVVKKLSKSCQKVVKKVVKKLPKLSKSCLELVVDMCYFSIKSVEGGWGGRAKSGSKAFGDYFVVSRRQKMNNL